MEEMKNRLSELRKTMKKNQTDFAKLLGITQAAISAVEYGLLILDEKELIGIRANVEALAEAKKGKVTEEVG
jgi:DNA-binding XRE family transcriptional regulator